MRDEKTPGFVKLIFAWLNSLAPFVGASFAQSSVAPSIFVPAGSSTRNCIVGSLAVVSIAERTSSGPKSQRASRCWTPPSDVMSASDTFPSNRATRPDWSNDSISIVSRGPPPLSLATTSPERRTSGEAAVGPASRAAGSAGLPSASRAIDRRFVGGELRIAIGAELVRLVILRTTDGGCVVSIDVPCLSGGTSGISILGRWGLILARRRAVVCPGSWEYDSSAGGLSAYVAPAAARGRPRCRCDLRSIGAEAKRFPNGIGRPAVDTAGCNPASPTSGLPACGGRGQ